MKGKAAIYTRVSTERQAEDGFSLDAQRDILTDLVDRKGLQLYRIYSDPGVSGGSFIRPGVQALIADMKAKKFDTILIHKLDRLSRNMGDLYDFIGMVNKLDVRLIIAAQGSEEIDTRSPMGKAFLMFSGIWAEIYLDNLREETLKGLVKKAQLGGKHISRPPLGYSFDSEYNLVLVEDEAELIRTVFKLYLEKGWGVVKIAKHMNEFSRGKEGGLWDGKRIRTILTNPTYAGYNHFKPDAWSDEKRILNEGIHEAIICREDFEKARRFIDRRAKGEMSKRSFVYPYGGLVKCEACGATFSGNATVKDGKIYRTYRCYNNYVRNTCDAPGISERAITKLVFDKVSLMMDKPLDAKPKEKQKSKKEKFNLQKEVEISNKRRKNWMMALGDGNLTSEAYAMLIGEEDARMKGIYAALSEEDVPAATPEIPAAELVQMVEHLKENWDLIDDEVKKETTQSMFRKIVIKKEKDGWSLIELQTV
ncbi:site-specific DNA recombinase [Paenibacillus mucilaginosus]|uniref:recombinase family protein n=1 Tax=Paenibacillus mucilaginosus TaxID=61624 RepID=UPI003D1E7014